jgi:hypothetical protein
MIVLERVGALPKNRVDRSLKLQGEAFTAASFLTRFFQTNVQPASFTGLHPKLGGNKRHEGGVTELVSLDSTRGSSRGARVAS